VIRHNNAPVWFHNLAQYDMAAVLPVLLVSNLLKRFHNVAFRYLR
jgi:hypothetical protein